MEWWNRKWNGGMENGMDECTQLQLTHVTGTVQG